MDRAVATALHRVPARRDGDGAIKRRFRALVVITLSALSFSRGSFAAGSDSLERQAEQFVKIALALGTEHPEEIDGYFGPARLDVRRAGDGSNLGAFRRQLRQLSAEIAASADASARRARLQAQVRALGGLVEVLDAPAPHAFESEAKRVYGMTLPPRSDPRSIGALQALEKLLPGPGSLASKVERFREQFVVPPQRRKALFERALSECRARTLAKWQLPAGERLNVEWTEEVDAAWHRYDGHAQSTLRLNPAAVAFLSSALDVACHEGYPGHHAQFVVMEESAGAGGVAVEDTVVLLRSPISMLREGAANYGVELAFSPSERVAFERDVLFPLAGFDPAQARKYEEVNRLAEALTSNVVPIVRDYRDGRLAGEDASRALESLALVASPEPLLRFVDRLGPYVLGYTAAQDKVRSYIETQHRLTGAEPWNILHAVLAQSQVTLLQ